MKILLDHCVPRPLGRLPVGHSVTTARAAGWDDMGNGELLELAGASFDVLLTVDQNLMHQHDRSDLPITVVVLATRDIRIDALEALVPDVRKLLAQRLSKRVYAVPPTE